MFGLIGIGPMELLILACFAVPMFLGLIVVLLAAIRYLSRPGQRRMEPAAPAPPMQALSHQDVLRSRYFHDASMSFPRTCPRCRAPLTADAPEGLCPACLLAGGLEGESLPPTSSGHGTPAGACAVDAVDLAAAFPHLEIVELLGQGGMGTVFKVRQKNLDRLAALKVIPPQAALDPSFAERFSREARALARLNHSSIVTVYDFGQAGGYYFLLMEYVDGPNLRQLMRSERIAPREALAIVPQICDALQYAHDQGIVHRDIKPENVLLDRTGRVKIADFGLAKLLGKSPADFTLTHTQQVMGTPRYMAPEQIERPLEVDHRADIYSLGVVIYEMLTGELPIGRFAPPSQKVAVDVRLDEIVLRTLEKEPARRYQQVSQVKTEIESVGATAGMRPMPAAPTRPSDEASAIERARAAAEPSRTPPLGIMLAIAIGMVVGMLMMGGGLVLAAVGMLLPSANDALRYSLIGSGLGVLGGGAGGFFGTWNSYRQLAGAVDLMQSPEVTWFDHVMKWYAVLGAILLVPGTLLFLATGDSLKANLLLLIGSVMAFQGLLVVLWRWGARQQAAASGGVLRDSVSGEKTRLRPGFWLAVVVPTLAIAAVWLLVLLDFHFMTGHWPTTPRHDLASAPDGALRVSSTQYNHRQFALNVLSTAAAASTSVVFLGAWLYRSLGPRKLVEGADRALAVSPPFSHPAWPLAVAVLGLATLVFPWVRLELDSVVRDPDFKAQLTSGMDYDGNSLRQIARMPGGVRHVASGVNHLGGVASAILAIAGTVLAASMVAANRNLVRPLSVLAVVAGILAVLAIISFGHQIGERDETLVIDDITLRGLARVISIDGRGPGYGSLPALVLANYLSASPAFGMYVAASMAGLLILIGVTKWSWAVGAPELTESVAAAKPVVAAAPSKEALGGGRDSAREQVRWPGMGLIVSGGLGLAPIVLFCVAIPISWIILVPVRTYETHSQPQAFIESAAKAMAHAPVANIGIIQPPVILAQAGPPLQMDALPTWSGLLLAMIVVAVMFVLSLPASILLILGGMKMRQLRSYGLAYLAAIVALLPLGPQWLISLPMGIWALSVLGRPKVKAAFE